MQKKRGRSQIMLKHWRGLAAGIVGLSLLAAAPAKANTYHFTFTSEIGFPSYDIQGVVTTSNALNGGTPNGYDITAIVGTMIDPLSNNTSVSLFGGNATPPAFINNPSWVDYDNSLIPGSGVSSTGGWMLLSTNGYLYNLWLGNGSFNSTPGLVYLYSNDPNSPGNLPSGPGEPGTLGLRGTLDVVNATPLPSTWTMLIAGFIGLGFFASRGTKKGSAAFVAA
jgi:hypothetical protein